MTTAAATRESKALDAATESLLQKLTEARTALANLVLKIDTDQNFNWASFLDSYSLISGQLNLLLKTIKSEKTPQLSRYIVVPRILTMDRDDVLSGLTENRVEALRHDLVPNYLRTKPDPVVESRYSSYEQISYNFPSQDAALKMLHVLDKVTKDTTRIISREKDDMDTRMPHKNFDIPGSKNEDTFYLINAVTNGTNLRPEPMSLPGYHQQMPIQPPHPHLMAQLQRKVPSTVKTNIRAGAQVHPYQK